LVWMTYHHHKSFDFLRLHPQDSYRSHSTTLLSCL
jgi:hypothetical protein